MSDLLKSALSYIGSSSSSSGTGSIHSNSLEVIKLGGEPVRLLKVIAEGGSSYIYAGQFTKNNLVLAVKKIPCQRDTEDRILSEIKFMNNFNHVNIAQYFGYNKICGVYWIGLEYCSVVRLPLLPEHVGPVFGQIVSGVDYLHNLGITHWDLKVENCMLGRDQRIKLIDFGSASTKTFNTSQLSTVQRNQLEDELFQLTTPMYRPPEILDLWSEMPIDFHVDLWALGCILYYLVHSEHPFSDSNKLAIINCKYTRKLSTFENIIEGLLVINPTDRTSLQVVLQSLKCLQVDYTAAIPITFEEFQIVPNIIPNSSSTSILHSIRGGAESLFKNLKESSSRIYSTQPQQHQQQADPSATPPGVESFIPVVAEKSTPRRPPPPSSPPDVLRKQAAEEVVSDVNAATSFDLLSGFESQGGNPHTNFSNNIQTATSVDLLGGFKEDAADFISDPFQDDDKGVVTGTEHSDNILDELFDLNQPTNINVTHSKSEMKKDLFDAFFSEQPSTAEKPLLPTSSSFHHLSSLKVESKYDLVKSTPNLNDIFGDLLLDQQGGGGRGQASSSSYGAGIVFGSTSNPSSGTGPKPGVTNLTSKTHTTQAGISNDLSSGGIQFSPFSSASASVNSASDKSAFNNPDNHFKIASGVNSPIFDAKTPVGVNKKIDLNAAFGELLNEQGFSGSSTTANVTKTINEMRRNELMQTRTPEQIKVNDWVEGKRKNIRALLSSLHTVVWESCSWKVTSMSVMVEVNDVKKVYRKACLAIHPDKQRGEPWEELAKLIFVELNEAWSHFEKDHK